MHHVISDGWSLGVLRREFTAMYTAFCKGEPNPLPELPIQHVDFAVWQRQWMGSEVLRRQAEYWRATLKGAPALLELPADHIRPARQEYAGSVARVVFDEQLSAAVRALGRRHQATLYMTFLGAFAALLGRLSGQQDIVIGTPVANRVRAETESLIGFFANNLVLRLDLSGSPTVGELIDRAREQALGAQRNQDIPFERVVELVDPVRSLNYTPLFQVMFAWQNTPKGNERPLTGLEVGRSRSGPPRVTSRFDIAVRTRDNRALHALPPQSAGGDGGRRDPARRAAAHPGAIRA
jgi:hypothetical protein